MGLKKNFLKTIVGYRVHHNTGQLVQMSLCRRPWTVPVALQECRSPLRVEEWGKMLSEHPDKPLVQYILQGISEGFRIGFRYGNSHLKLASNLLSAKTNLQVVMAYLQEEVGLNRVVGPLPMGSIPGIHISSFGVIPKGHMLGGWRLIVDLELCSLSNITVDMVGKLAAALGRKSLLAKLDIKSAYRIVSVHPEDRPLRGMEWKGELYVDTCLPFGLRSTPRIFTALVDALE